VDFRVQKMERYTMKLGSSRYKLRKVRKTGSGIHLYSLIDCMLLLVYILSRDKWMSTLMTTELFTMQQQPLSSLLGFVEIILMIIMTRDYSNIAHPYSCSPLDPYKQACFLLTLSCMTMNLPSQSVRSQASQHIQKPSQCKNASYMQSLRGSGCSCLVCIS